MNRILRIDASARQDGSHSRALGDYFQRRWLGTFPDDCIKVRDLVPGAVGQIEQATIAGFYTTADEMTDALNAATDVSNELIAELQAADMLLITTPMYNFTVPASLKAWIDQIVRIGHTFSYDGQSFCGLVNANRAYVICAYGAEGYLGDGQLLAANFLEPYLRFLLEFLGIDDVRFVSVEATTADEATVQVSLAEARADVDELIASEFASATTRGYGT